MNLSNLFHILITALLFFPFVVLQTGCQSISPSISIADKPLIKEIPPVSIENGLDSSWSLRLTADQMEEGKRLSEMNCGVCHVRPLPDALPKSAWVEVFDQLYKTLIIRRSEQASSSDDSKVNFSMGGSLVLPPKKLAAYTIQPDDFNIIKSFYLYSASEKSLTYVGKPAFSNEVAPFSIKYFAATDDDKNEMHSLAMFDSTQKKIILGDPSGLKVLDTNGRLVRKVPLSSMPTGLTIHEDKAYVTLYQGDGKVISVPLEAIFGTVEPSESIVISGLRRAVHATFADFDKDGVGELLVEEFGFSDGELLLFKKNADGKYNSTTIANHTGIVGTVVADFTGHGRFDIATLFAQADEGLSVFENKGDGNFIEHVVSRDQPSTGNMSITAADMNNDGLLDIITVSGDVLDLSTQPTKNYQGVRIWLNQGNGNFKLGYFYPMNGAAQAIARDFRGVGKMDLAVIASFPDFDETPLETFVYLENQGDLNFVPKRLPGTEKGRWMVAASGDFNGDGKEDMVLGAAYLTFPKGEKQGKDRYGAVPRLDYIILENISQSAK